LIHATTFRPGFSPDATQWAGVRRIASVERKNLAEGRLADVRRGASDQGYSVADRGRLKVEIHQAYAQAHGN